MVIRVKRVLIMISATIVTIGISSQVHVKNSYDNSIILGGKGSVSISAQDILSEKAKMLFFIKKGYIKNNKRYIEGYFDKFVTDLDEARQYERETGKSIIVHDKSGDYLDDDGFDMPISNVVTLEVDNNVKITELDFDSNGCILHVDKDFNSIITEKYKDWPYFDVTLKNGIVTEMYQEYRP